MIDPATTRIESLRGPLHFLEGLRIADLVGLPLDVPVFADNDARVSLAGEMMWGAARGRENALMLTLGNGVGGAALVNGRVLRGHSGMAGNMGHLTVNPHGSVCSCGNRGCLETVFSARAIEAEASAAVHRGCDSVLTRLFRGQPQLASCRTVFQAASEGDTVATWPTPAPTSWSHCRRKCGAVRAACWAATCPLWSRKWPTDPVLSAQPAWPWGHAPRPTSDPQKREKK
jgi:glucokinase